MNPDYKDMYALKAAVQFYSTVLQGKTASIDLKTSLGHQLRIAMIEESDKKIKQTVDKTFEEVKKAIIKQEHQKTSIRE